MGFGENCKEEWTWAAWLSDVVKPHVEEIVVCNPRRNALNGTLTSSNLDARALVQICPRMLQQGEKRTLFVEKVRRARPSCFE